MGTSGNSIDLNHGYQQLLNQVHYTHLIVESGDLLDRLPMLLLGVTVRGRDIRFDIDVLELRPDVLV